MDLNDFIPFKNEFNKACQGITSNATQTSDQPVFEELRVRRYRRPMSDLSGFIVDKIDRWIGWLIIREKTAAGGITTIRAEVSSIILFGLKVNVTFGLFEERDSSGLLMTTVNAKAETQIGARGDLGESRRVIRMMLGALDFNFKKNQITEEDYHHRSLDTKGASAAMQQIFNEAPLEQTKKSEGMAKATPIEFKKKTAVQTIQIRPSLKKEEPVPTSAPSYINVRTISSESSSETVTTLEEPRPSKPKITIVTTKKTL